MVFIEIIDLLKENFQIFRSVFIAVLLIVIFNFIVKRIRHRLLKKTRSKKQISNIKIMSRILSIVFFIITIFIALFAYIGSWTGFGVVAGLITAGLGFALQKPITGVAAYIMLVVKRPFHVGDKICIGEVRGEVYDITLTHIYLDEIGGELDTSLHSGRSIMVPNHLLFENNIINYTLTNDYVLKEINFDVTYESDLDRAIEIANKTSSKLLEKYMTKEKWKSKVRVRMEASSVKVRILFYAPVKEIYQLSSDMTKEIYDMVKKDKDVEIAYPHTEIIFKNKKIFDKKQ